LQIMTGKAMATWAKLKVYMKLSIVIYNRYNNWPIPKPSIRRYIGSSLEMTIRITIPYLNS
jgi:hypothetical protein